MLDQSHTQRLSILEDKTMSDVTTAVSALKNHLESTSKMVREYSFLSLVLFQFVNLKFRLNEQCYYHYEKHSQKDVIYYNSQY